MSPDKTYDEALQEWGLRQISKPNPATVPAGELCPCIFCKGNREYEAEENERDRTGLVDDRATAGAR